MSHALLRDALLVTGSLNAKEDDRTLDRSQIHPVQLVTSAGAQPLSYFDAIGDLGVSALALRPGSLRLFYTEGTDLFELDLATGTRTPHPIPRLRDVHEIEFIGDTLWLSNTGYDEAVGYHPDTGSTQREQLRRTEPHADPVIEELAAGQSDVSTIDRFHCNQVFEGYDSHRYALVHHVSGLQLVRRIAQKLIKSQGNGGVINLDTGEPHSLRLKAPHSVRRVAGAYWVFSSGHAKIHIYDNTWTLQHQLDGRGWGRGASLSLDTTLFYAGVSAPRKRYKDLLGWGQASANLVEVFDVSTRRSIGEVHLDHIEQVNNVYTLTPQQAEAVRQLT
ncbi:MAG: hypothetical protein AAF089_06230 [Bacteroidota bacterium]